MKKFTYEEDLVQQAIKYTEVLLRFCDERRYRGNGQIEHIRCCLHNLKINKVKEAIIDRDNLRYGNREGFKDEFVKTVYPHEDYEYADTILDALFSLWSRHMSYLDEEKEERTKRETEIILRREARDKEIREKYLKRNEFLNK